MDQQRQPDVPEQSETIPSNDPATLHRRRFGQTIGAAGPIGAVGGAAMWPLVTTPQAAGGCAA